MLHEVHTRLDSLEVFVLNFSSRLLQQSVTADRIYVAIQRCGHVAMSLHSVPSGDTVKCGLTSVIRVKSAVKWAYSAFLDCTVHAWAMMFAQMFRVHVEEQP